MAQVQSGLCRSNYCLALLLSPYSIASIAGRMDVELEIHVDLVSLYFSLFSKITLESHCYQPLTKSGVREFSVDKFNIPEEQTL